MAHYVRIPPRQKSRNKPPPTKRYRLGGAPYLVDDDPKNPRWYAVSNALADKLRTVRSREDAPLTFEVLTKAQFEQRMATLNEQRRIQVKLRDVAQDELNDEATDEDPEAEAEESGDSSAGRVDVGVKTRAKKAPAKKAPAKKTHAKKAPAKRKRTASAPKAEAPGDAG